jgi:hypothetical protein
MSEKNHKSAGEKKQAGSEFSRDPRFFFGQTTGKNGFSAFLKPFLW